MRSGFTSEIQHANQQQSEQKEHLEAKNHTDGNTSARDTPRPALPTQSRPKEGQISPDNAAKTDGPITDFNEISREGEQNGVSRPRKEGVQCPHPPIYQPPAGVPPAARGPSEAGATEKSRTRSTEQQNQAAEIKLRILFERGGYCRASLLPKRPPHLQEKIRVSGPNGPIALVALEEDWYQDIVELTDLGHQLRNGIVWTDESTRQKWILSGRELFVLSASPTHRGFVSTSRLALGQEHAIACTTSILPNVENNLRDANCNEWTQLEPDDGVPDGWVVLRGVVSTRPLSLSDDADILNVLRPLPAIQIEFQGGIRLRYRDWLAGYPPSIHVYGDLEHTERVFIDGQEADRSNKGCYTAPNWDADGNHHVRCGSKTASYSLVKCEPNWELWPASSFGNSRQPSQIGICGPLVRSFARDGSEGLLAASSIVQVPRSNPVLIGRHPWEVFIASPRMDLLTTPCIASPPFKPIWAIPAQPLRCHKLTSRIFLVGDPTSPRCEDLSQPRPAEPDSKDKWCSMILDAGRKGLAVDPIDPRVQQLWHQYKATARQLWKRRRSEK